MTHSLNRVSNAILIGFVLVALSLAYWSVFASDNMLSRSDNPRRVEAEEAIIRGAIYDRNGQVLAEMVPATLAPSGTQLFERNYVFPEVSSATGYYSLVHGVGGIEASFDKQLRGDDLISIEQAAANQLLHQPARGSDLRLTIDSKLQSKVATALKKYQGAVIAIDVPSGAVRAIVSSPGFDPNQLNATYNDLLRDPKAPLLNRVIQGTYQPGGALQTVILAAILTDKNQLNAPSPGSTIPVKVNGLTLTCVRQGAAQNLAAAYSLACPYPFADAMVGTPGVVAVAKMFESFGLLRAPTLAYLETISGSLGTPLLKINDLAKLRAQGVGQADLTVTPLQMALVASIIANHGNAITPYLADAIRQPDGDWKTIDTSKGQTAIITLEVADNIRTVMRQAVTNGAAQAADQQGVMIYGHASIAYTGPRQNADSWFIGFVDRPDGTSVAIAVVVEGSNDPAVAAQIAGVALAESAQ